MSDEQILCFEHTFCKKHTTTPSCQRACWPWPSQCVHTYTIHQQDGRPSTPTLHIEETQMNKSNERQTTISNNNQSARNVDSNPPTPIYNRTNTSARKDTNNKTSNINHQRNTTKDSQLFVRPRTPQQNNKHIPIIRQESKRKTSDNISHEHQQPSYKKRFNHKLTFNPGSIRNRNSLDSNDDRDGGTTSIHYHVNRSSFTSNISTNRTDTTHAMAPTATTSMDNTNKTSNFNTLRTTTHTKSSITTKSPDTTDHRRRSNSCSSSGSSRTTDNDEIQEEETISNKTYYTFILHKNNQNPNWQTANRSKPSPTFIAFDHGSHYNILYAADDRGGNGARQRGRIATYLGATIAGNTEVTATHSKIQFLRRFILYCIRNGIETANQYGARINQEMKEAYNIFQTLFHNRDPNTINNEIQECKKYIEENKQFSRLGRNKRRNVVDTISDIIKQYNIKTNAEWNIHVDTETKHQLMREYGLSVDNYVQRLIRANKHKNLKYYKYVPTAELLLNELHNYMDNHETIEDNFHAICDWLNYLFTENGIDLPEFLAWNACIKDMRYTKINTLVLQGPTNAGKSLIADALVSICQPEEITREKDNSGFHLDQLPEASAVIFEEPCITPVNAGTWKLLFEGKQIKTDIKHKDKEGIRRLPIWITTATKVTANITPDVVDG